MSRSEPQLLAPWLKPGSWPRLSPGGSSGEGLPRASRAGLRILLESALWLQGGPESIPPGSPACGQQDAHLILATRATGNAFSPEVIWFA